MRFTTQPVGAEWFDDNVPCTRACPVLTNAGRYVTAIAAGDDELAYRIARLPNPFPSICGRVCAAPCEAGVPAGPDRRADRDPRAEAVRHRAVRRRERPRAPSSTATQPRPLRLAARRVAIIGAGPAGMACAHDLATYGYRPVVFEAQDRPGGMMVLGIPPYRLRRDLLQDEIRAILDMGVELRTNQRLGRDFSLAVAEGRRASRRSSWGSAACAGATCRSPASTRTACCARSTSSSTRTWATESSWASDVLVIGGGNVALDAARTALREIAAARHIRRH